MTVAVHRRAALLYRALYSSAVSAGGTSFSALMRARVAAAAALARIGLGGGGGGVAVRFAAGVARAAGCRAAEEEEVEEAWRRCVERLARLRAVECTHRTASRRCCRRGEIMAKGACACQGYVVAKAHVQLGSLRAGLMWVGTFNISSSLQGQEYSVGNSSPMLNFLTFPLLLPSFFALLHTSFHP